MVESEIRVRRQVSLRKYVVNRGEDCLWVGRVTTVSEHNVKLVEKPADQGIGCLFDNANGVQVPPRSRCSSCRIEEPSQGAEPMKAGKVMSVIRFGRVVDISTRP